MQQTAFYLFADLRRKICIRPSYVEGVRNYGENGAQVQVQIFPVFPAHYDTPKLGLSGISSG